MNERPGEHLEQRCAADTACIEVLARVEAGQRAIHELDLPELGHRLLRIAERIAEVHRFENADDR